MGKVKRWCAVTLAFGLIGYLDGCAAYEACGFRGCAGDRQIASSVQASIDRRPELGPNRIDVQTSNRVVYLYGLVDTYLERQLAESVAVGTPGVTRVVNAIAIDGRG